MQYMLNFPIGKSIFQLVQGAGFEPAKRLTADLESAPFDHSGTPAWVTREDFHCSFFLFMNIQ